MVLLRRVWRLRIQAESVAGAFRDYNGVSNATPLAADAIAAGDNMFAGVPGEDYHICICSWKPDLTPDDLHVDLLLILCLGIWIAEYEMRDRLTGTFKYVDSDDGQFIFPDHSITHHLRIQRT